MRYEKLLEISASPDVPSLQRHVLACGEDMGFGLVGLIAAQLGADGLIHHCFVNNAPDGFAEASRDSADSRRDPVLQTLKRTSVPIAYDQQTYVDGGCGDLWEHQAAFGYRSGIATAVHLSNSRHFLLGFDGDRRLPKGGPRLTRMMADLQLLTVHAQQAAERLMFEGTPARMPLLSERQLAILRWVANGKTAWETGQILAMTERAVNAQLTAIFRKLDAGSKTQAVYKAMTLGMLREP